LQKFFLEKSIKTPLLRSRRVGQSRPRVSRDSSGAVEGEQAEKHKNPTNDKNRAAQDEGEATMVSRQRQQNDIRVRYRRAHTSVVSLLLSRFSFDIVTVKIRNEKRKRGKVCAATLGYMEESASGRQSQG